MKEEKKYFKVMPPSLRKAYAEFKKARDAAKREKVRLTKGAFGGK